MTKTNQRNLFGEPLVACSVAPMTGYFRTGCCETDENDQGSHTVCAVMTEEFLQFSLAMGNDLITPRLYWNFPGLQPGDRWCLCVARWKEAYDAGVAPFVVLEATNENALRVATMQQLIEHAHKQPNNVVSKDE